MEKVFYIECSTGCSCCSNENFNRGFFKTLEEAESEVNKYLSGVDYPLCSQYAKYGRYHISSASAEFLPDGRVIIDNIRVFESIDILQDFDESALD